MVCKRFSALFVTMPLWEILFWSTWAKCERIENASSLQDMSAKKTCLRRFRLCQPSALCDNPRILSLPSPCHVQDLPHSGIVGGMGSRHVGYTKALLACDVLTLFVSFCFVNITGRQIQVTEMVACCMRCVLHALRVWLPPRWDICQVLSGKARGGLEHFEFGEFQFLQCRVSLQCFIFMHLLHPNPTPNSICLEPSCCHVNQTSSPCHWTCRHRCGQQFHSRRPGCGNILAQFFEIVCGADGEWSPEGAKQIKLWMEIELGVFDIDIYIYRHALCTFVHVPSACPFPPVCRSEEMSSQLSKVLCQISRGMARHCSPAAPAALTFLTMSTMRRIQVAEVAEVATWFWPIFRSWRHLGVVCTLPLKKVASPSHRYSSCWILSSPWSTWWEHAVGLKPSVMNVAGLWALRLLTFIMRTVGLLDLLPLPLMHMKRAVTLSCLASEVEEQCFTRPPFYLTAKLYYGVFSPD